MRAEVVVERGRDRNRAAIFVHNGVVRGVLLFRSDVGSMQRRRFDPALPCSAVAVQSLTLALLGLIEERHSRRVFLVDQLRHRNIHEVRIA